MKSLGVARYAITEGDRAPDVVCADCWPCSALRIGAASTTSKL